MTPTEIYTFFRNAMLARRAEGFTFVHSFGSFRNKTCCAVSSIYRPGMDSIAAISRETGIPGTILWEIAAGFDNCTDMTNEFRQIGRMLQLEFDPNFKLATL